jgi:hypothetical protein
VKNLIISIIAVSLSSCAPIWVQSDQPFEPTVEKSDLVFIRTGDRKHYYVIDTKRRLCFFHSRLYGKKHMVEIACEKVPEYQDFVSAPALTPSAPDAKGVEPPKGSPEPPETTSAKVLTDTDRENYRRVYVQYFCARKGGEDPDLEVILSRHGLDRSTYLQLKEEFGRDKARWAALTALASKACK